MSQQQMTIPSAIAACLREAMGRETRLYAVIDAARDTELVFAARDEYGLELHSLFEGEVARYLDHVAPHLVPFEQDSQFLGLWAQHLGSSAGVLMLADVATEELRAHLRQIFVVSDERGEEFSFRYYDPRVLRVYLLTCTGDEARQWFGPIRRILVEDDPPDTVLCCVPGDEGVNISELALPIGDLSAPSGGSGQ